MPSRCDAGSPENEIRFVHSNSITLIVRPSVPHPCIHTSFVRVSSVAVVCAFVFPDEPRVLCDPVRGQ